MQKTGYFPKSSLYAVEHNLLPRNLNCGISDISAPCCCIAANGEISRYGTLEVVNTDSSYATLLGHTQAHAAASGAAGVVRSLLEGEIAEPGAWMPEQVIDSGFFFRASPLGD